MTCLCFLFKLEGYKCYWCVYIHWIIAWYLAKVPIGQKLIIFWKYSWKLQPLSFLALTLKVFFVFAVDIWSQYLVWLILNVLVGGISSFEYKTCLMLDSPMGSCGNLQVSYGLCTKFVLVEFTFFSDLVLSCPTANLIINEGTVPLTWC